MTMNPATRTNVLQTYQLVLYDRALHPELFQLRDRRVLGCAGHEFEAWLMPGGHMLRFGKNAHCVCELVTENEQSIPPAGLITGFFCAGEHDFDRDFDALGINYLTTVQTEQLNDSIYQSTWDEMVDFAAEADAMIYRWVDGFGDNMSIVDIQRYSREVHAQSYHMIANGRVVLRTQTIFETHG
ncbi:MAG: hypothetical protein Kow0022_08770 [Phycisphaerales bacterium]